jgi:hypothetical protein
MKKIWLGLFVSIIMVGSVITGATSVVNEKINENKKVVAFEDGEITSTIIISGYEIESTDKGDYLTAEDFGRLLIPGKPNLPSKIFTIAIPPGAEYVGINYDLGAEVVISRKYDITPVPIPQVIGKENPEVRAEEEQIYQTNYEETYYSNNIYPESNVEFVRTAGFRKYNLVDVQVVPFSYQPLSGELSYYPEISVSVSYSYPEGFNPNEIMIDNVASFENRAQDFILNYNQAVDWYPVGQGGRDTYDYVIITLDTLVDDINDLVDWEEAKGRSVNVVTTSWISSNYGGVDLEQKMRNFLRDKYPSDEWAIEFVCLIGSYDDVPIRLTAQNTGYGRPETDFYYAELSHPDSSSWDADSDQQYGENSDPVDFYAEVYVGRIPWSDPTTVEHICQKSVAYEQNDDPSFKKNILLLGAFFWSDTDNAVLMEYKTDDTIHAWMSDWTMTKMYEQGQTTYPMDYNLEYNNVKNVWSTETFAFVDWAGHGSPTACYEYYPSQPFVDTDTLLSLNDDFPAIIFADACSNSDTDYDNIGQMALKQGAVGFLGATKVAYGMHAWTNPMSGSSQSLDYWFTTGCTEGILTQGQSHQIALQNMYVNNLWYYDKFEHFEWGALWGNPGLTMGQVVTSNPPNNPQTPTGPNEGVPLTEFTFTTATTDPDGDQIYYKWSWGDGTESEWIGPINSGQTAEATNMWDDLGNYEIKVIAKDENGAKSDWSDSIIFPIVENTPPDTPIIEGATTGKTNTPFKITITSTDPHDHDVYFNIHWGNAGGGWSGPYPSGQGVEFEHTWTNGGKYVISVSVKDSFDAEGDSATFEVLIIRDRVITSNLLVKLLGNLINSYPFFGKILDF